MKYIQSACNRLTGLILTCPVTSRVKGYALEVPIPETEAVNGAVLADQVGCADWRVRRAEFLGRAAAEIVAETQAKLAPLLGL